MILPKKLGPKVRLKSSTVSYLVGSYHSHDEDGVTITRAVLKSRIVAGQKLPTPFGLKHKISHADTAEITAEEEALYLFTDGWTRGSAAANARQELAWSEQREAREDCVGDGAGEADDGAARSAGRHADIELSHLFSLEDARGMVDMVRDPGNITVSHVAMPYLLRSYIAVRKVLDGDRTQLANLHSQVARMKAESKDEALRAGGEVDLKLSDLIDIDVARSLLDLNSGGRPLGTFVNTMPYLLRSYIAVRGVLDGEEVDLANLQSELARVKVERDRLKRNEAAREKMLVRMVDGNRTLARKLHQQKRLSGALEVPARLERLKRIQEVLADSNRPQSVAQIKAEAKANAGAGAGEPHGSEAKPRASRWSVILGKALSPVTAPQAILATAIGITGAVIAGINIACIFPKPSYDASLENVAMGLLVSVTFIALGHRR